MKDECEEHSGWDNKGRRRRRRDSIGPESQIEVTSVNAQALSTGAQYINASTSLGAASINATEVSARKYTGDEIEIGSLKVHLKGIQGGTNAVSAYSVEATQELTTPKLTHNGKAILNVQELNTSVTFKGVGLDGTIVKTYSQYVRRFLHDITPDLHVLVINTKLTDIIPFKQMIMPLDLECAAGTAAFDTTVVKTSSGYTKAIVEINETDGKLQAKFIFDEGTEYTSMQIKVNMIFF